MSGTRSPSRKGQAIEALIIAHGQPSDPAPAEKALGGIAQRVADMLPDWTIRSATMAAPGEIERRLEQAQSMPLVYPLFMSGGWFTQTALPKRLGFLSRARILRPFGLCGRLPIHATDHLCSLARQKGWRPDQTEILIAAHGSASGRDTPARSTYRFAHALSLLSDWKHVRVGFLEQDPELHKVAATCGPRSICVPFFAADGYHVANDIPESLAEGGFSGPICPSVGRADYVPGLIADALQAARLEQAA